MKLVFLIAGVCLLAIAAFLGGFVDGVDLRDVLALACAGLAAFAASFLPIP